MYVPDPYIMRPAHVHARPTLCTFRLVSTCECARARSTLVRVCVRMRTRVRVRARARAARRRARVARIHARKIDGWAGRYAGLRRRHRLSPAQSLPLSSTARPAVGFKSGFRSSRRKFRPTVV